MAVFFSHCLNSPFSTSLPSLSSSFRSLPHSKSARISCSSSPSPSSPQMDPHIEGNRNRFMDFPYVSGPYRDLMVELLLTMESRLETYLLPCTLPQDVQYFHNDSRTAHGFLHIRTGIKPSPRTLEVLQVVQAVGLPVM